MILDESKITLCYVKQIMLCLIINDVFAIIILITYV
jgi:hypothetical protein